MKNYIVSLIVALLSVATSSLHSMQANFGTVTSINCDINTGFYKNEGTIQGTNNVTINASTLSGNGSISAWHNEIFINANTFDYAGCISAGKECTIKSSNFKGNATIQAPCITIITDEWDFKGTLTCDDKCVIYAKKPFDTNSFTHLGKGEFKIVISPYNVKRYTLENLSSTSHEEFYSRCIECNENAIENEIKEIRTQAALNLIEDKAILEAIKKELEEKAAFHKERLHEKQDLKALKSALIKGCISSATLIGSYLIFTNRQILINKWGVESDTAIATSGILGILSLIPGALSIKDFDNWRNPRHQEKYAGLVVIINKINEALATERIVEEQIINL